jgi:hypothetical protein
VKSKQQDRKKKAKKNRFSLSRLSRVNNMCVRVRRSDNDKKNATAQEQNRNAPLHSPANDAAVAAAESAVERKKRSDAILFLNRGKLACSAAHNSKLLIGIFFDGEEEEESSLLDWGETRTTRIFLGKRIWSGFTRPERSESGGP